MMISPQRPSQPVAFLSKAAQRPAGMPHQPSAQPHFAGGDGFDGIMKGFAVASMMTWAGIVSAVGGGLAWNHYRQSVPLQQNPQVQQSFAQANEKIENSLSTLAKATPETVESILAQHKAVIQDAYIGHIQNIEATLSPNVQDEALKSILERSQLSPEELAATQQLMNTTDFKTWEDPIQAFDTFADTVLAKHADADTVQAAKTAMKTLNTEAAFNQGTAKTAMWIAVIGALSSAGLLGLGMFGSGGMLGPGAMLYIGPAFIADMLMRGLKRKKYGPPKESNDSRDL